MFTGLIEEKGTITGVEDLGDSVRVTIRAAIVTSDADHGDSIAVNGCCLTVMDQGEGTFAADVMRESLDRTALGDLQVGDEVNLERATRAGARLGGHIVQGHVDGTGTILDRTPSEHWEIVRITVPTELAKYLVSKGSVTVDGTSLTVVEVVDARDSTTGAPWFSVSLIPTTLADTTLGSRVAGDRVNLEVDILAKYVERLLGSQDPAQEEGNA